MCCYVVALWRDFNRMIVYLQRRSNLEKIREPLRQHKVNPHWVVCIGPVSAGDTHGVGPVAFSMKFALLTVLVPVPLVFLHGRFLFCVVERLGDTDMSR